MTNGRKSPLGADFSQVFERLGDFRAAAIEQGGVGIIIVERGEAGKRRRRIGLDQFQRLGVEANIAVSPHAGIEQSAVARHAVPVEIDDTISS